MINRSKMRRQLYRGGGITGLYPRKKFGLGSDLKDTFRKLIPNELADVAVKAAPFVAMIPGYGPTTAALMRGIGRFDQRGSISDALKQGALTYGGGKLFGAGMEKIGLRDPGASGIGEFINQPTKSRIGGFFGRGETPVREAPIKKAPTGVYGGETMLPQLGSEQSTIKNIWDKWQGLSPGLRTAIVGTGSGAIAGVAQWFENQIPQEPGESMDEYIARRKVAVGKLMRQYMDNTRAYDAAWTTMTDEQKDAEVAKYNMNQGGRVGYQTGGITMANTLAENIRINQENAMRNRGIIQSAQSKLPVVTTGGGGSTQQNLVDKFVNQPSILGPAAQQAAKNKLEGIQKADAALDMLNKTSMSSTGTGGSSLIPGFTKVEGGYRGPDGQIYGPETYGSISAGMYPNIYDPNKPTPTSNVDMANVWSKQYGISPNFFTLLKAKQAGGMNQDAIVQDFIQELNMNPQLREKYNLTAYGPELEKQLRDFSAYQYNQGGRVGLYGGGEPEAGIKSLEAGAPDITYEGDMRMSRGPVLPEDPTKPINPFAPKPTGPVLPDKMMAAKGGRIGYRMGMGPAGLPGIPRQAPDGMEFDMRQNGGFQGLGAKEGKDDVPAMLAKNEFVFTADAVRGAGGGDIELGAQRMYDTMKNLEKRVV